MDRDLLQGARKRAGLSQEALAERLSVSQALVSKVENGTRVASLALAATWLLVCGDETDAGEDFGPAIEAFALDHQLLLAQIAQLVAEYPHTAEALRAWVASVRQLEGARKVETTSTPST